MNTSTEPDIEGTKVPESETEKLFNSKDVFTTGEAAIICKVSQQTIIRCFDLGLLGGFRVPGSKFRRITRHSLALFMKNNGIPVDASTSAIFEERYNGFLPKEQKAESKDAATESL